jgi:Ca2+/Na+ antiporter
MVLNQFITLFLLVLFFSWSLFLMVPSKKKQEVNLESPLFLLMVAPEIFLALILALASFGEAVLGLVMGVNLLSFLLVPGLVALFRGQAKVVVKNLRLDFLAVFLIVSLPLIFLRNLQLSRIEGFFLLAIGILLFVWYWRLPALIYKIILGKRARITWRLLLGILLSTIFFLFSVLTVFSLEIDPPLFILGLLPLALIVSLPEILVNLELTKRKPLVFLDGLLIPLVFNVTLVLGLAAFLSPFRVGELSAYFRSVLLFLLGFALFYFLAWSKKRIDRREGAVLVLFFFLSLVIILA